jgi:hypothetical protein
MANGSRQPQTTQMRIRLEDETHCLELADLLGR